MQHILLRRCDLTQGWFLQVLFFSLFFRTSFPICHPTRSQWKKINTILFCTYSCLGCHPLRGGTFLLPWPTSIMMVQASTNMFNFGWMSQTELSEGGSTRGFATGEKGEQFLQAAAGSTHLSWWLPPWSTAGGDTIHSAARVLPVPQAGIYVALGMFSARLWIFQPYILFL